MKIFVAIEEFSETQLHRIAEIASPDNIHLRSDYRDDTNIDKDFFDCEIVFGNVPASWVEKSSSLRWMQLESVGFGEYRHLELQSSGKAVVVTNLAGFFADPVAQSALAGILSLYRGMNRLATAKTDKQWLGDPLRGCLRTLTGANVLLFGFGAINQRLVLLLTAFDCHITHFGRRWSHESLDKAVAEADIVVCSVPETDETTGVFDHIRLALFKPDALFVNFGRGSVVDENALATALQTSQLGGSVLDVTLDEPLPKEHVFWNTPNTILTQHSGGGTADELDRKINVFAANLLRYRNNQALQGIADFKRGY